MEDSAALLRMLEPTVRPVSPGKRAGAPPRPESTEQGRFENMLHQLYSRQHDTGATTTESTNDASTSENGSDTQRANPGAPTGSLSPLAQLDQFENASLRQMIAQLNNQAHTTPLTNTNDGENHQE